MYAQITFAALFATAALSAPAPAPAGMSPNLPNFKEMPEPVATGDFNALETHEDCTAENDTGELWTIQGLSRQCNDEDTECVWKYHVDTEKEGTDPYYCEYTINDKNGVPASQRTTYDSDGYTCEVFHITQEYYPERGEGYPGYTVIAPRHPGTERRIYSGFDDNEYANGEIAVDKAYCVEVPPQ